VTGLRYVAVPLGVNSHRPHAAANVLKNGFGDCKDKANLLNALLRAQGIAADLVLVPRFAQAYPEAPGRRLQPRDLAGRAGRRAPLPRQHRPGRALRACCRPAIRDGACS
jgi:transglutaminase-like putative cysteine protease